jgi:hypothetical protein
MDKSPHWQWWWMAVWRVGRWHFRNQSRRVLPEGISQRRMLVWSSLPLHSNEQICWPNVGRKKYTPNCHQLPGRDPGRSSNSTVLEDSSRWTTNGRYHPSKNRMWQHRGSKHAETARRPLLEKQVQAGVLWPFKRLIADCKPGGRLYHIYSHSDKHTRDEEDRTLEQRLNIHTDNLAGNALTYSVKNNTFINITSSFPRMKKVTISIGGCRIYGSPKVAIYKSWGRQVAKKYFSSRKYVSKGFLTISTGTGWKLLWSHSHRCSVLGSPNRWHTSWNQQTAITMGQVGQEFMSKLSAGRRRRINLTHNKMYSKGRQTIFKESVSELWKWL